MTRSPHTTVAQLLRELPDAARKLEILGIDVCCGADQPLARAVRASGLDPQDVLDLLEGRGDASADRPFGDRNDAPLPALTREIVRWHHRRARYWLVKLIPLAAKVCSAHAKADPGLWKVHDELQRLARELIPHMQVEERYLFPYIESMELDGGRDTSIVVPLFGTVEYPLQSLRHEHAAELGTLREIRTATRNFAASASACDASRELFAGLRELEHELKQHILLEDDVLFRRAVAREKEVRRAV